MTCEIKKTEDGQREKREHFNMIHWMSGKNLKRKSNVHRLNTKGEIAKYIDYPLNDMIGNA